MIRNVIFDMVGVLISFDTHTYMEQRGFTAEDRRILDKEVFRSLEWARLDRGTMTEEEALKKIMIRTPSRLHGAVRDLLYRENRDILTVGGMEAFLQKLKLKGYHLFMLSNTCRQWHVFWKTVPLNRYFEDTLISADVGLVKPDPEIFRLACRRFGAAPEETAYIDDTPINAEAASYIGMQAFVFNDEMTELKKWFEQLTGEFQ